MAPVALEGEVFLPRVPIPAQKAFFGVLVLVGRMLGYKASYPQYSNDRPERT